MDDQMLYHLTNVENGILQNSKNLIEGFNDTYTNEVRLFENQVIIVELMNNIKMILLLHVFLIFLLGMMLSYVTSLVEKLKVEETKTVDGKTYVALQV